MLAVKFLYSFPLLHSVFLHSLSFLSSMKLKQNIQKYALRSDKLTLGCLLKNDKFNVLSKTILRLNHGD